MTDQPAVMPRARTPIGPGRITLAGIVLAGLTTALGVVGVRDALDAAGVISGAPWVESTIDTGDGMKPQWWLVPVGVLAALVGLRLLVVAVWPRPRTAVSVRSRTGVFMRPKDVTKLARRAADDVDGVMTTRVRATRRAATMNVVVTGNDGRIQKDVETAVQERLSALDPAPRLTVRTRAGEAP